MKKKQEDNVDYTELFSNSKLLKKVLKKKGQRTQKKGSKEIRKRRHKDFLFALLVLQKQKRDGKINKTNSSYLELFEPLYKKELDKLNYNKELSKIKKRAIKEEKSYNKMLKFAEKIS